MAALLLQLMARCRGKMAKSSYVIRTAGAVRLDLLKNFPQVYTVEPGGTILRATQLDESALLGLIDALREAGIDLVEVRREPVRPPS